MKKKLITITIIVVFFSLAITPNVSAEETPPTIKVYKENILIPETGTWQTIQFDSVDNETLFENCAYLTDNGFLRIQESGLYSVGGSIHIELSSDSQKENVYVLIRARRNENDYLLDTQRELHQEVFKSSHEESISFTGVNYFDSGDNLYFEYLTNDPDIRFKSDSKFSEKIASSMYISVLTDDSYPKIIDEGGTNYGMLGMVFGLGSILAILILVLTRKQKGGES